MKPLTDRNRQALEFIICHIQEFHYPPTYREICTELGLSAGKSAQDQVALLISKGYLANVYSTGRMITVLKDADGNMLELRFKVKD